MVLLLYSSPLLKGARWTDTFLASPGDAVFKEGEAEEKEEGRKEAG